MANRGWVRAIFVYAAISAAAAYAGAFAFDVFAFMQSRAIWKRPLPMYVGDAARGYALKPNFTGRVEGALNYDVRTNAKGYRDREWRLDAPFRVLVVGDSYVFGQGLPIKKGLVRSAEKALRGKARFFNAGVPGYGLPHIRETLRLECPAVRPRHVVYMYYFNDTRLNDMDVSARGSLDGYLVSTREKGTDAPVDTATIRTRIAQKLRPPEWSLSASLRLLNLREFLSRRHLHPRQIVEGWLGGDRTATDYLSRYHASADAAAYPPKSTPAAKQMIDDMKRIAADCQAGFSMFVLPAYQEGYYGISEPATERLLKALADDPDIVDLRTRAQPGVNMTLSDKGDYHYNAAATAWVGSAIAEHLRGRYPELGTP